MRGEFCGKGERDRKRMKQKYKKLAQEDLEADLHKVFSTSAALASVLKFKEISYTSFFFSL